jgi:hypothetical protein
MEEHTHLELITLKNDFINKAKCHSKYAQILPKTSDFHTRYKLDIPRLYNYLLSRFSKKEFGCIFYVNNREQRDHTEECTKLTYFNQLNISEVDLSLYATIDPDGFKEVIKKMFNEVLTDTNVLIEFEQNKDTTLIHFTNLN